MTFAFLVVKLGDFCYLNCKKFPIFVTRIKIGIHPIEKDCIL